MLACLLRRLFPLQRAVLSIVPIKAHCVRYRSVDVSKAGAECCRLRTLLFVRLVELSRYGDWVRHEVGGSLARAGVNVCCAEVDGKSSAVANNLQEHAQPQPTTTQSQPQPQPAQATLQYQPFRFLVSTNDDFHFPAATAGAANAVVCSGRTACFSATSLGCHAASETWFYD